MDEWESRLVKDVRQALEVIAKCGEEKITIRVYFRGRDYGGIKVEHWEKRAS